MVQKFETCKTACDTSRTQALSTGTADLTAAELTALKTEWDVFQKCAYNVDGANAGATI